MSYIHVIHENDDWTAPLLSELDDLGHPYRDWHMGTGEFSLDELPPSGIFYSRMSASSHTRGHRYAPELTAGVLAWLEGHGARVLNGSGALALENTNYNASAEARAGISGMRVLARFLGVELARYNMSMDHERGALSLASR